MVFSEYGGNPTTPRHQETTMIRTPHLLGGLLLAALGLTTQAQSLNDLKTDHATPKDVLTYGMGYNNQRYSPLKQITTRNASKLKPVWAYSLNNPQGQESQPIVHG
eukprot:Opistho-1_new@100930